jgi:hypothetical protein
MLGPVDADAVSDTPTSGGKVEFIERNLRVRQFNLAKDDLVQVSIE